MSGLTAHNQLAPVLRQLKLTGMLDTLDARLAEARAGTLGHVDFLQTLCEDELSRRDAAKIARRLRAAHLPTRRHLRKLRLLLQPEAARGPDPRPGPAGVHPRRRIGLYIRAGRSWLTLRFLSSGCVEQSKRWWRLP